MCWFDWHLFLTNPCNTCLIFCFVKTIIIIIIIMFEILVVIKFKTFTDIYQCLPSWYSVFVFIWNISVVVTIKCICKCITRSFVNVYYLATSFDIECRSSSGHCIRRWMRTETKYHEVGDLPFYINKFIKYVRTMYRSIVNGNRLKDILKTA